MNMPQVYASNYYRIIQYSRAYVDDMEYWIIFFVYYRSSGCTVVSVNSVRVDYVTAPGMNQSRDSSESRFGSRIRTATVEYSSSY